MLPHPFPQPMLVQTPPPPTCPMFRCESIPFLRPRCWFPRLATCAWRPYDLLHARGVLARPESITSATVLLVGSVWGGSALSQVLCGDSAQCRRGDHIRGRRGLLSKQPVRRPSHPPRHASVSRRDELVPKRLRHVSSVAPGVTASSPPCAVCHEACTNCRNRCRNCCKTGRNRRNRQGKIESC